MQTQPSTLQMIKELKEVKGMFNGVEQVATGKAKRVQVQQQAMLELGMRLQMSLDVDWLIEQFMQYVHAYLLFDGFQYSSAYLQKSIAQGRQKGHQCSYNLSIENEQLGGLTIFRGRKYSESELMLLENLLCSLLYPLRNAMKYHQASLQAHVDSLTGVNNRSTFDCALKREMNLAERNKQSFSLLVIDIDYFKQVNDTYGHSAGDEVLKKVAATVQQCIRNTDLLFRYGGEEFVAILNNSDCEAALEVAQRILQSVDNVSIDYMGQTLTVTVSIGLACLKPGDSGKSIFDRADKALYKAKHDGRNQVRLA
ncbi:MAG: GGDEF domain-containing protein [Gammaproteobacteria bacterium]|nr:MAG: GGDEF domain-containing protein [Gammaproteobacteria bacterium]